MKTLGPRFNALQGAALLALLAGLNAHPAGAQNAPLAFESAAPIVNEFGQVLPGSADGGGALVQLLAAPNGIYPPDISGQPHPSNAVLAVTHIGAGTAPSLGNSGLVSGAVILNRAQATRLFARVFNRETLALSSFYGDSAIYTNPTAIYGMFLFNLAATTQALDSADDDGDGLNNSWEKSYGADKNNPDTDGDGVADGDEHRAGTGLLDDESYLAMIRLRPAAGGAMLVEWDSVAGKRYQVQVATPDPVYDVATYSNITAVLEATTNTLSATLTNAFYHPRQFFRVRLVE